MVLQMIINNNLLYKICFENAMDVALLIMKPQNFFIKSHLLLT